MGQIISGESAWRRTRRTFTGTAPAAGSDWTVTVPAGKVWRVLSVRASLVTSATVANRAPALTVSDGSAVFLTVPAPAVQAASLTGVFDWYEYASAQAVGNVQAAALPELIIPAGFVLASSTAAIAAGDQWSAPVVYVIETWDRRGPIELLDAAEVQVVVLASPAP